MKLKSILIKVILLLAALCLIALVTPGFLKVWVSRQVQAYVYTSPQQVPSADVALVLGAGLRRNGRPTAVLHDRVVTAVELYKAGKVKKLLMSGDNQVVTHNEPAAMQQLALELGVPAEDIVMDYAGRRTYDSCYRAGEIFEVQQVVVVTQRFHLDRAIYLCQSLGLEAKGVAADRRDYRPVQERWWSLRETVALVNAWLDIHVLRPVPVLGEKLPIELSFAPPGVIKGDGSQ